jgi:SpoVK/Ycf46/Vps4 family AAA+-type ATPase
MMGKMEGKVEIDVTQLPSDSSSASASFHPSSTPALSSSSPLDALSSTLSHLTPGFSIAGFAQLFQHALLHASLRWDSLQTPRSSRSVVWADFEAGLHKTKQGGKEGQQQAQVVMAAEEGGKTGATVSPSPSSPWPSIGGYSLLKSRLSLTLFHWLHPERIQVLGLRPISGVLFYGESGCGKTLWATSLAQHSGLNFLSISVASIYSQYLGESEKMIRKTFAQAAQLAPCVLMIDHIDAIAGKRDGSSDGAAGVDARVLSTFLNELDGVSGRTGVYVVGCTTHPDALDSALMRPGRFDDIVEVTMPTCEDREEILKLHMRQVQVHADVDLAAIARMTDGFTGADLKELISKAGMNALRSDVTTQNVKQADLIAAWEQTTGTKASNYTALLSMMNQA